MAGVIARRCATLVVSALVAGAAALGGAAGASASVSCPASAASSLGPVQWTFGVIGAPTSGASGVTNSWTRGNGTWNGGSASGTICTNDKGSGIPKRDLVLKVAGASTLSPKITRYGLLGVGIALPVTVTATDDSACPTGSRGTVTLFASYYSTHKDSIALHFTGACAAHDHTFTGTLVKVEIQRNGAQVNST